MPHAFLMWVGVRGAPCSAAVGGERRLMPHAYLMWIAMSMAPHTVLPGAPLLPWCVASLPHACLSPNIAPLETPHHRPHR